MTNELCISACQSRGYSLAGLEFGQECWCGNSLAATSTMAPMADCMGLHCVGNVSEFCAMGKRLLVYSSGA